MTSIALNIYPSSTPHPSSTASSITHHPSSTPSSITHHPSSTPSSTPSTTYEISTCSHSLNTFGPALATFIVLLCDVCCFTYVIPCIHPSYHVYLSSTSLLSSVLTLLFLWMTSRVDAGRVVGLKTNEGIIHHSSSPQDSSSITHHPSSIVIHSDSSDWESTSQSPAGETLAEVSLSSATCVSGYRREGRGEMIDSTINIDDIINSIEPANRLSSIDALPFSSIIHHPSSTTHHSSSMKWCPECEHYVPLSIVHCIICKGCMNEFDHHCPFVSNCIAKNNHKYFLAFLFCSGFGGLNCFYFNILCVIQLINKLYRPESPPASLATYVTIYAYVMMAWLMLSVGFLFPFFIFQCTVVLAGHTTKSMFGKNKYKSKNSMMSDSHHSSSTTSPPSFLAAVTTFCSSLVYKESEEYRYEKIV